MLPALCGYHAHFEWTSGIHFVPFGVFAVIAQLVFIWWFWSFTVRFWLKLLFIFLFLSLLENNFFGKCRECLIGTYLHCLLTVHWKGRSVTTCSTHEIWFPVTSFSSSNWKWIWTLVSFCHLRGNSVQMMSFSWRHETFEIAVKMVAVLDVFHGCTRRRTWKGKLAKKKKVMLNVLSVDWTAFYFFWCWFLSSNKQNMIFDWI